MLSTFIVMSGSWFDIMMAQVSLTSSVGAEMARALPKPRLPQPG